MSVNFDSDCELIYPKIHNWQRDKPPATCFSNKAFLAERWKWYKKLEQEGFQDIEYFSRKTGEALPLMDGMGPIDLKKNYEKFGNSKSIYYTAAEAHASNVEETYGYYSEQAKVWRIHVRGFGSNTVSRRLELPHQWVHRFVKREAARMWDLRAQEELDDTSTVAELPGESSDDRDNRRE